MKSKSAYLLLAVLSSYGISCKENSKPNHSTESSVFSDVIALGKRAVLAIGQKSKEEDMIGENYELRTESFPRADIGLHQIAGSDLTGTPKALQGIWWMDGNPVFDETVSFANVDFTAKYPLISVFGENNFSFHSGEGKDFDGLQADTTSRAGYSAFIGAQASSLVYEFHFTDKTYTEATIIPIVTIGKILGNRIKVSEDIVNFSFKKAGENLYLRPTSVSGKKLPDYFFRRILVPSAADPKVLEKTEFWDEYVAQKSPTHLRLTKHK